MKHEMVVALGLFLLSTFAIGFSPYSHAIADVSIARSPQKPQSTELLPLMGAWKGSGKFSGRDSNVEMKWESVLGGRFVRLSYRNTWKTAQDKTLTIEGHAYYQSLNNGEYRANWFDSYGKARPIEAKFENGALSATWGTPATELGKTVYKLVTPDQVEIIDTVQLKDGSWREFHRALLRRE